MYASFPESVSVLYSLFLSRLSVPPAFLPRGLNNCACNPHLFPVDPSGVCFRKRNSHKANNPGFLLPTGMALPWETFPFSKELEIGDKKSLQDR